MIVKKPGFQYVQTKTVHTNATVKLETSQVQDELAILAWAKIFRPMKDKCAVE